MAGFCAEILAIAGIVSRGTIISIIGVRMNLRTDDGNGGRKVKPRPSRCGYRRNFTSSSIGVSVQFPPVGNGSTLTRFPLTVWRFPVPRFLTAFSRL